jgi:hypothetical protein
MAVILLIWLPLTMFSQNKPYLLFSEDDGLANNSVKSITKDQDGMLWLGTENGISKYDGQKFLNIRKSDGLPGNRVWAIASDHKGKIYAGCYHDGLAVIENNRVTKTYHIKSKFPDSIRRLYYSDNFQMLFVGTDFGIYVFKDSVFYEMKPEKDSTFKSSVLTIVEYKNQIYFSEFTGSIPNISPIFKLSIDLQNPELFRTEICMDKKQAFTITVMNDTGYVHSRPVIYSTPLKNISQSQMLASIQDNFLPWVSCAISNHEILLGGFNNGNYLGGLRVLNTTSGKLDKNRYGINDQTINDLLYDTESETTWICTGEGLIALINAPFESTKYKDINGVSDIEFQNDTCYILAEDGLFIIRDEKIIRKYSKIDLTDVIIKKRDKLYRTDSTNYHLLINVRMPILINSLVKKANKLFLVTNQGCISVPDLRNYYPFTTEKFIFDDTGGAYFIPDYQKLMIFPSLLKPQFSIIKGDLGNISDILKIIRVKDLFLFASFYNGLYAIKDDKVYYLNESNSDLNNYLTSIDTDSAGEIWCTSIEGNLFNIGFDNDLFIKRKLNSQNSGIVGDVCKWLKFNNSNLYLGTNKGLNIIPIAELQEEKVDSVQFFNKENGYDFVSANNPFTDNEGNIYVRALNQLIKISNISVPKSPAKILVEDISLNNSSVSFEMLEDKTLPSSTEGIKLKFLLVKYPGSKNTSYRYRVNAGNWNEGDNLNFEAVKAGSYVVDLEAKDIETGQIYLKTVRFQISTPLSQRWWFILLITTICLSIAWVIFKIRMNLVNKQHQEKYRLLRENSELQIRSLQVQMNPHFIFNILNSIQSLIMQSKIKDALQYLSSLGSIIRMNLENVSEEYIPFEEEIRFLKKYIEIEELRFKKKFQIELKNDIPEMNLLVPPMLIQPIIENAIKHGVRGLNDGGLVTVGFTIENENLVVTVEDNGIGRMASNRTKIEHHQSKGQELIEKRLNLLNEKNKTTANSISITDLEEKGQPSGTKVIVTLELIWAT